MCRRIPTQLVRTGCGTALLLTVRRNLRRPVPRAGDCAERRGACGGEGGNHRAAALRPPMPGAFARRGDGGRVCCRRWRVRLHGHRRRRRHRAHAARADALPGVPGAKHARVHASASRVGTRYSRCFRTSCLAQDGSLQDVCDAVLGTQLRLPAVAVLRIVLQVAEGLAAMHAASPPFAHRDVKPANVLLSVRLLHVMHTMHPFKLTRCCFALHSAGGTCSPRLSPAGRRRPRHGACVRC